MAASILHSDRMTRDDALDVGQRERGFRRWVEDCYRAGRVHRRRVEALGVFGRTSRKRYINDLKGVLATCLRNGLTPEDCLNFRKFCRQWIKRGAPIDPKVLWIPTPSLQITLRQTACAFPTLGALHADARLWLSDPVIRANGQPVRGPAGMKNPKNFSEFFIPFNLCLHAPQGTPYAKFNAVGFEKVWIDPKGEGEA